MQKFRNLTHKWDIFSKMWIFDISNMAIFRGVTSKIEYHENESPGCEFHTFKWGSKVYYLPFARIFAEKSAILADVSQNPNFCHIIFLTRSLSKCPGLEHNCMKFSRNWIFGSNWFLEMIFGALETWSSQLLKNIIFQLQKVLVATNNWPKIWLF